MSNISLGVRSQNWDGVVSFEINRELFEDTDPVNQKLKASIIASHINAELKRDARSLFSVTVDDLIDDLNRPIDQRIFDIQVVSDIAREGDILSPQENNTHDNPPREIKPHVLTRAADEDIAPAEGTYGELGANVWTRPPRH